METHAGRDNMKKAFLIFMFCGVLLWGCYHNNSIKLTRYEKSIYKSIRDEEPFIRKEKLCVLPIETQYKIYIYSIGATVPHTLHYVEYFKESASKHIDYILKETLSRDITDIECWGLVYLFHEIVRDQELYDSREGDLDMDKLYRVISRTSDGQFKEFAEEFYKLINDDLISYGETTTPGTSEKTKN